ncbi:MAG: ABC transporter permease [Bryobacteraceae bacterium]|jgi:ABC-type polysaccharide/polyol phosphate export permease
MSIPGRHFARILVERRALLFQLVRRDFQQRFVGSAAGWLWGFIHPLVMLLSYAFVFQVCLHVTLPAGDVTRNYTLFLFAGFLPWLLFQETVTRSAASVVENAGLITKTVFPAEVLPVSVFLSSLANHLMALLLMLGAIGIWERRFSPWVFLLPLYMMLLGLLAVGIGWIVAALQVYIRDTAQMLSVVLTVWFWTTPILLPESRFPPWAHFLVRWNPLARLVRAYRDRLFSWRVPNLDDLAILAACSLAVFIMGGFLFRHLKRGFADVL